MADNQKQPTANAVHIKTAWTQNWEGLKNTPSPMSDGSIEGERTKARFQDDMVSLLNSEHLVVLAGLGASIGVSSSDGTKQAPSMSALWEKVAQYPDFDQIETLLSQGIVDNENFEFMLSDAQARLALIEEPSEKELLEDFVSHAEQLVWEGCNFIDESSKLPYHEALLRRIARRSTRLQRAQVFTTNYDLAFEQAAANIRAKVIDGFGFGRDVFEPSSFDLDFVRRRPNDQPTLEPNVFQLLKLHGSVDWNGPEYSIKKIEPSSKPEEPVLIYPSATKYQRSYQQPYSELMSRFQMALRQPNVGFIVVGFGFNDAHIVAPIQAALQSNVGLKMLVVDPGTRSEYRSDTFAQIEQLIDLQDNRLSLLEGTFKDLLSYLPELSSEDEHSTHLDRAERVWQESRL